MARDKIEIFYILSLLIVAGLLVLFAHGVFSGISAGSAEPVVEIKRIDLFDDFRGNYSKISVMLANNDTVSHVFSINTLYDEELEDSLNITVYSGQNFTYQRDVLTERIPTSENASVNSTLRIVKFVIYIDEQIKPFAETSFIFKYDKNGSAVK
jgi:phage major head subunit gpT-like protein